MRMEKASKKRGRSKKGFWKIFDKLSDVMAALAGAILVFITAAVCYTIFMRFLFNQTTIWIIPMTEYALLWIVFLGTTWLLREGGHITTDVIYVHLNEKTKHTLDCIMSVIGGLACAMMVYLGIVHMWDCIIHGVTDVRAVTVPKSAIFIIIPIGSILLTIQFFRMAWSRLIEIRTGR
ncbi:MAG: TRAP transporter small permease [Thermodesulfobacteriota bacterium]|jgi:TRAP-type C4-dicarboxylate transport system permease small subunit